MDLRGGDEGVPAASGGEVHPVTATALDRVATVPNLISLIRILLIPAFVYLIAHKGTEAAGLALLAGVVSTDWVDGAIARRTGQVSNVGKLLDPVADRLAIAAALIVLAVRDAFPLWAALLVLVRDALVVAVGLWLLAGAKVRIDVRWIGKVATFGLMAGFPLVAWGNFGLALAQPTRIIGWSLFWFGVVLYYAAAFLYATDLRRALRASRPDAA